MVTVVSQSLFFVGQGRGSAAQAVSIIHRNPSSIFASTLLLIEFRPHPRPSLSQSSRHCRPSGLPRPSLSKSSLHRIQFAGPGPVYDYLGRRLQVPVVIGVAAQGHSPTSFKLSSIQIIESSRHGISPVYHSSKSSHQSSPPPRPEFRQSVIHRPGSRVDGPLQAQPESSSESGPSKSSIRNHRISSSPVTVYYFCSVSRAQYLSFEFSFLELGRVGQGPVLELSTAAFRRSRPLKVGKDHE